MVKKSLLLLVSIFLLFGCESGMETPSNKVESFFSKYQKLDKNVLLDLDNVLDKDSTMNKEQKKIYKDLMERQYQNLSYKINNEETNENVAIVEVEIEVLNYKAAIEEAKKDSKDSFIDTKLDKMKEVEEKIKYDLTFFLTKEEGKWKIEELEDRDYQKIYGLF